MIIPSIHSSKKTRLLVLTITQITAITVLILTAALFVLYQQGIAHGQQQERLSLSNQTAFGKQMPIQDLSFDIDNTTFSHHTASVNGIQMHYVIGGQGEDPVVLLHGWPQSWYKWRHI